MKLLSEQTIAKTPGVRKARMPRPFEPMKAVLVDESFDRKGWIFEDKWDGARALCYIRNGRVTLYSRNRKNITSQYPELSLMHTAVRGKTAIVDGEIVALDKRGNPDFDILQWRFGLKNKKAIERLSSENQLRFFVFDLIYLDGYDLRRASLLDRKKLLSRVVKAKDRIRLTAFIADKGQMLFRKAQRQHREGIMAKNGASIYVEKRSSEWLKIKTIMRQEAVICGYAPPHGDRKYFSSLELGLYQGKDLISVGGVGAGFSDKRLKEVFDLMQPLKQAHHPFAGAPRDKGPMTWLKPRLVCEVRFSERTDVGSFRHPVFEGIRFDKSPKECKYEWKHSATGEIRKAERSKAQTKGRVTSASPKKRSARKVTKK